MIKRHTHSITQDDTGYTMIELIVVIAVISTVLFISLPKFSSMLFSDSLEYTQKWISVKSSLLREKAMTDQKDYALVFDFYDNTIRIEINTESSDEETDEFSEEEISPEEEEQQKNLIFTLPEDVKLTSLIHKNRETDDRTDKIVFYRQGYSNWVILNLEDEDGERKLSMEIEPFIMTPVITGEHTSF